MKIPHGTANLLGLGLKFCIESPWPQGQVQDILEVSMAKFCHSVCLHLAFKDKMTKDDEYIPNLYIPSDWDPPFLIDNFTIENALTNMETML